MKNAYTVINASAGSGKTYELVQRLLMICLKTPDSGKTIGNILALTFTNKAANEMKERILKWLASFVKADYDKNPDLINIQKAFKKENIHIPMKDLHERSKVLLDYILHHYSALNIGTIDKFNAKLVRSFSNELGLAQNFNLEINPEPFLIEAVDKMLDQIGENDTISEAFMDFINYNLDNNDRVNLNETLYKSAKKYVDDIHYEPLKRNKDFDWEKYELVKTRLRTEIKDLKNQSQELAKKALATIKGKDLENADFYGGGKQSLQYFFDSFLKNGAPKLYDTVEGELHKVESYRKGASHAGKAKENIIFEILEDLLSLRSQIIDNQIKIAKKEKILSSILPLKVNKDIQDQLKKIEDENDVVLLSKFNILINENLRNEPSEFIYEKVGAKFQHYFFDEFQDTSELQWKNFIPLRNNAVSSDDTSFTVVGDPKQSIYRFRGGESRIMLSIINGSEDSPKKAEPKILGDNWRSAKNIVEFNNELYQYLSGFIGDENQSIFGAGSQQTPRQTTIEGRVKITLVENLVKDDFFATAAQKMQKDIQECIDNGFSLKDITILCRRNEEIFNFSKKLGLLKIQYEGQETYIRTISESGLTLDISLTIRALMEFLKWESNRSNRQHIVTMMYWLNELGRVKITDFTAEMHNILAVKNDVGLMDYIVDKYNIKLVQQNTPQLNLYNFIEYYLQQFCVEQKETDFLLNFLELLYGFTQNAGATLKDFIKFWEEEGSNTKILASENIDAVQLMTVHKAKGLEFPVVFLPMRNKNDDAKFSNWYETENSEVQVINTTQFGREMSVYDDDIHKFNEENISKNLIDRFCGQYVATTRPVEQLYLYLEKPPVNSKGIESESLLEIYKFFQSKGLTAQDEFDYFKVKDLTKKTASKKTGYQTKSIKSITANNQRPSAIKIATPSKSYQARNEHVRNGIFTHDILSQINSGKDVEKVLQKLLLEGAITEKEKKEITLDIGKILQKYPQYFIDNLEVINEKDILASNGKYYRPDRLIKTPEGWIVVDFKTGELRDEHIKQIENYQQILEGMGRKVIATEIIYI